MRRSIVILSAVYALCLASAATTAEHDVGMTCQSSTSNNVQLDGTVSTCQSTTEPADTVDDKALAEDVLPAGPAPARRKSRDAKADPKAGESAPKQRRAESPDALRMLGLPSPRQVRSHANRVSKTKRAVNAERPVNAKKAPTEEKAAKVEKQSTMEDTAKKDTPTSFKPVDLPDAQAFRAAFAAPWKRAPVAVTKTEDKEALGNVNSDKTKPAPRKIPAHSEKRFPSTSSMQGSHENNPQLLPIRELRERTNDFASSPSSSSFGSGTVPLPETPSAAERLGLPNTHDTTNNSDSDSSPMPRRSRRVEQFVQKLQSRKVNVKSPKWLPQGGFLFVG